jgi:hypothetical protein
MNEQGKVILVAHTDYEGAQRAVDIIHGFLFGLLSFVDPLVLRPDPGTGG